MMDKNQSMIEFLQTCPAIKNNPLFFNFGSIEDNAYLANTKSDDKSLHKPFIDGSVERRYTFSIDSFKSVAHNPVVQGYSDENLTELEEVQKVLDWITEQDELQNFPDFGNDCTVEKMSTLTTKPELVGVDTSSNPPIAVYRISIQIDYIDNSKKLWN
jgi:hypothetical protein